MVTRKIKKTSVEHGWMLPKQRLEVFTNKLEETLSDCHGNYLLSAQLQEIHQLRKKFETTKAVIRKTDKSKVFHLGTIDDYQIKAQAYMMKTQAYENIGLINPLESLVERTNDFLLGLWVRCG